MYRGRVSNTLKCQKKDPRFLFGVYTDNQIYVCSFGLGCSVISKQIKEYFEHYSPVKG